MTAADVFRTLRQMILLLTRRVSVLEGGGGGGGSGITTLTGDISAGPGSGSQAATLSSTGVSAGTYGDGTHVGQFTVDAKGRLTAASEIPISGGGGGSPGGIVSATGLYLDDGSEQFAPVFPVIPPINGDFAWVNQGGATLDTAQGSVFLLSGLDASTSWRMRTKAAPATPYTITIGFIPHLWRFAGPSRVALIWRESGGGTFTTMELTFNSAPATPDISFNKWAGPTSFSGSYGSTGSYVPFAPLHWYRFGDTGTNRTASVSIDGRHWEQIFTIGRTDFLTPDEIGFGVDANSATYHAGINLISWEET